MEILKVENLRKTYGKGTTKVVALDNNKVTLPDLTILRQKIHDEEREDIEKRKKKNTENLLKIKENINKGPKDKIYLYQKKKEKFLSDEYNLVKLEKIKRKAFMKHINLNEFSEIRKNYEQIKSKKVLESNLKIENIKKSWAERHKLIPPYISPLSKLVTEENNKTKLDEKKKLLKIKTYFTKKLFQRKNT